MKKVKQYFIFLIIMLVFPMIVEAGSIRFNTPVKTSENTYEFTLTVDNIALNAISGNINITNGTITNIKMASSWINQTGNNANFYFYHNGSSSGTYTVATIEVTMTGNSEYKIQNLEYKLNKCKEDVYAHYFGENGTLVSKEVYDKTCSISKDATLKSLSPSSGTLTPTFKPSLELYSMTVNNNVSSIKWNPITNSSKAKVTSGTTCTLKVGLNVCRIVVEAEAGNKKTYTITVTRKNASGGTASSDASIKNLQVHGGTLTKTFSSKITEYNVKPNKNANSIYFTFTMNSNNQTYTSQSCNITSATKTCKLTVTAEDGVTKMSYLFNIIQENNTGTNSTSHNTSTNTTTTTNNSSNNTNSTKKSTTGNVSSSSKKDSNSTNVEIEEVEITHEIDENRSDNQDKVEENQSSEEINQNENEDVKKEKIKIPLVNKEIEKNIFFIIIATIDLAIGVLIGVFITKHHKKEKTSK